jgi:hypothetical protein
MMDQSVNYSEVVKRWAETQRPVGYPDDQLGRTLFVLGAEVRLCQFLSYYLALDIPASLHVLDLDEDDGGRESLAGYQAMTERLNGGAKEKATPGDQEK